MSSARILDETPAVRLRGTVTTPGGDPVGLDMRSTASGRMLGTVLRYGERFRVLTTSGKVFIRASRAFWRGRGRTGQELRGYTGRWVRVPPSFVGADLEHVLAPGRLARWLRQVTRAADGPVRQAEEKVRRAGWVTIPVETPDATVYVTAAHPRQVVGIETSRGAAGISRSSPSRGTGDGRAEQLPTGPGEGTAHQPLPPAMDLDLLDIPSDAVADLFEDLEEEAERLREAADSQVQFRVTAQGQLAPCGRAGCTLVVPVANTLVHNEYRRPEQVRAALDVAWSVNGLPMRCADRKPMSPNSATTLACSVVYFFPPRVTVRIRTRWHVIARAMVPLDVRRVQADLDRARDRALDRLPCGGLLRGPSTTRGVSDLAAQDGSVVKPASRSVLEPAPLTSGDKRQDRHRDGKNDRRKDGKAKKPDPYKKPGKASGIETLLPGTDRWMRNGRMGRVPLEVAEQLTGRRFNSFGDFRKAFWRAIGNNPVLAHRFNFVNRKLMRSGLAPFARTPWQDGALKRYELHHIRPLSQRGGLYRLDNIVAVTPRQHKVLHYFLPGNRRGFKRICDLDETEQPPQSAESPATSATPSRSPMRRWPASRAGTL